jgi:hypothetical protein
MKPYKEYISLTLILLVFQSAKADFINLVQADKCESIIEIFIEDDHILARLEIGENDYRWFSDVVPREFYQSGYTPEDQNIRWRNFLKEKFVLQQHQIVIQGKVMLVEQRPREQHSMLYTGEEDTTFQNDKVIYVEIQYVLDAPFEQLSIQPPLQPGTEQTLANIGFVVYHKTIPVNDLRFLVQEETIHLNWGDPWYSYFENPEISRHHSSSFMSFLYVEPYEVRHEILVRIKDLEDWIDFGYGMEDVIEIEAQQGIKNKVADFLVSRNIVKLDGEERAPIIDRVHFIEVQLSGIQIMEIPKPLNYASAILGIIFTYPDEGIPQKVTVCWDMFSDKIKVIPALSMGPEGPWPYDLKPEDNVLEWKNFLTHYQLPTVTEQKIEQASVHIPIFTIVFVLMIIFTLFRAGWKLSSVSKWRKFFFVLYILLAIFAYRIGYTVEVPFLTKKRYSEPEAKELVNQLLKNTYRAFDFRMEGDVYDKLALCNDEQLLQNIYLDTRKSMVIENQGGIEAKVNEVFIKTVQKVDEIGEGMGYQCNWIVKGEVGHWGHKHQRINEYDAIIRIKAVDGSWKMYDLEIIEEKRL